MINNAGGNSQSVLNRAEEFMKDEKNSRKFNLYGKYLAFDCGAPPNIQAVLSAAKDYELLISNSMFEIWLLMHFEDVYKKMSKKEICQRLERCLNMKYYKADKGKIREIMQKGNIEKAIDNARALERRYLSEKKNIFTSIKERNPYTSVYKLTEQLMLEISD